MKISFTQIYPEVETSFDLSHMVLVLMRTRLDELGKEILFFKNKLKSDDFTVVFIVSATRNSETLIVKGPLLLRKRNQVEFSLFIPYSEIVEFTQMVSYVLNYIAQGIIFVLNKYETDSSRVEEIVQDVIQAIHADPEAFQYK